MEIKYKERLLKSFPKELWWNVLSVIEVLYNSWNTENDWLFTKHYRTVKFHNENLEINDRVYFKIPEKSLVDKLSKTEQKILNCILLYHHNWYIREENLIQLKNTNEYWIIPYKIQLIWEYVYEILEVIYEDVSSKNKENYRLFISENPLYWNKIKSRVISYWNEYYRNKYPEFKEYLGSKIIDKIENNNYCPVCNHNFWDFIWQDSNEICPQCFIQFWYDDCAWWDEEYKKRIYKEWKNEWENDGSQNKWRPNEEKRIHIIKKAKNIN